MKLNVLKLKCLHIYQVLNIYFRKSGDSIYFINEYKWTLGFKIHIPITKVIITCFINLYLHIEPIYFNNLP